MTFSTLISKKVNYPKKGELGLYLRSEQVTQLMQTNKTFKLNYKSRENTLQSTHHNPRISSPHTRGATCRETKSCVHCWVNELQHLFFWGKKQFLSLNKRITISTLQGTHVN